MVDRMDRAACTASLLAGPQYTNKYNRQSGKQYPYFCRLPFALLPYAVLSAAKRTALVHTYHQYYFKYPGSICRQDNIA